MASSFISQIPGIIHLVEKLHPRKILDIGKGFGKYVFLIHEYCGIDNQVRVNPEKSLKDQSNILIDAIEVDPDLMLPHLEHIYNKIYFGDILKIYELFPKYQLVLMIDIIEHIKKEEAFHLLEHLLKNGSKIIIATPIAFFEQELYKSKFENHVSHWKLEDFENLANVDVQYFDAGAVYLLSKNKLDIRGFGNGWIKKVRRIARAIKNEF